MLLGIGAAEHKTVGIKKVAIDIISIRDTNKTLRKKLTELEAFMEIGILPSDLSLNDKYVRSSCADRHGNINESYCIGVHFPFNNYEHYIKTTGKGFGASIGQARDEKETFSKIEIISGICLYGGERFLLKTAKGDSISLTGLYFNINEAIECIEVDDSLSVYEVEAIINLSTFINDLARWNASIKTVNVEIPKGQYYLFLADAYEKGCLSHELFQACLDEIDKRYEMIFQAYKKRLNVESVNKIDPLLLVEKYCRDIFETNEGICLNKAKEILSEDELWKKLLSVSDVGGWKDLGYLSSVYVFLKIGKKEPNKAVLQVDDPIEEKIQIKALKVVKSLGELSNYRVWGIYPVQKVVLNPIHHEDSDLYYCRNIKLSISSIKKIISKSRNRRVPAYVGAGSFLGVANNLTSSPA